MIPSSGVHKRAMVRSNVALAHCGGLVRKRHQCYCVFNTLGNNLSAGPPCLMISTWLPVTFGNVPFSRSRTMICRSRLSLPVAPPSPPSVAVGRHSSPVPPHCMRPLYVRPVDKIHVCVVEDDPSNLTMVTVIFRSGLDTAICSSSLCMRPFFFEYHTGASPSTA